MTPLKDKAIKAMLLGNWQKATSLNVILLKEDPNDIDALNRLAYAQTALGKIKDAKSTYRKVLRLDALNQIAMRNIKRLSEVGFKKAFTNKASSFGQLNHAFLEETGKTKIISLINLAQPKVISMLPAGQSLMICIKRSKIFIQDQNKQYIGVLPDDIGKRLIKLIKGGNIYDAYVKSAGPHNVTIFIKEEKRATRYKDYPSFLQTFNQDFTFSKSKAKTKNYKRLREDDRKSHSLEEDEVS
ncbi:MAG: hypothetical protein AAB583_04365 [Patescibacteria group bacterium]